MKPFAIFSAFLLLLGCTGPEGPVGPPGPTLFSQVFEFEVDFTPSNSYEVYFEFPQEIEVFEADLVLVFLAYETTDSNQGIQQVWRPLPQTIFTPSGLLQYQYDHTFSDMRLFVEADYSLNNASEADLLNQRFKVGVVPAAYAQDIQGLNALSDADFFASFAVILKKIKHEKEPIHPAFFWASMGILSAQEKSSATRYEVFKTDEQWKKQLNGLEYYVLRRGGTEYAFTSDLLDEKRKGTYVCAGCGNALFRSEYKYDSKSGWPSFDRPIEGALAFDVDYDIGYERTEEKCAKCGSHLGHVFDDGPRETTGKRHCINGVALKFIADVNK